MYYDVFLRYHYSRRQQVQVWRVETLANITVKVGVRFLPILRGLILYLFEPNWQVVCLCS
jgi:hypothetical protein